MVPSQGTVGRQGVNAMPSHGTIGKQGVNVVLLKVQLADRGLM